MSDQIIVATATRIDADTTSRQLVQNIGPGSVTYGPTASLLGSTLAVGASVTISSPTYFQGGRIAVTPAWQVDARTSPNIDQRLDDLEGVAFNARVYGVKADGRTVTDAAIATGTATLSSATAAFNQDDVNKLCVVVGAGTPVSGTLNGASGTSPVTGLTVNALATAIPPGGITLDNGSGTTQQFVTSGALAGATTIPLLGAAVGGLTSALSTGGPITAIPVAPLNFAVSAGTVTVMYIGSGNVLHTQTFTNSSAAVGASSITVTSATPNFAFPESSIVFGSPIPKTPTVNFPNGSTVRTDYPALSTTISSVSNGVATLAANAGHTVSGAECFYGTDNTTALTNCKTAAEAVNGTVVLPEGDIGISTGATGLTSNVALEIVGQGVKELYGGTSAFNDANWPSVAPYLKGSVIVQCAPNADIIGFTKQGAAQSLRKMGLRFAGRFQNTGHGIVSQATTGLGQIGSVWEDVKVFGQDGNHYAFLCDSPELMRWSGLRAYGGGGTWFKTNAGVPGPPGNNTVDDYYGCVFIAGIAQGFLWDCSSSPGGGVAMDSCVFSNLEQAVRIPSPALSNTTPPANGASPQGSPQSPMHTFNANRITISGYVLPGFESDPTNAVITWASGTACWRTNDANATFLKGSQDAPTTGPVSGTAYQNYLGKPLTAMMEFLMQPKAAASASTTTTGILASGATSIPVTSSTGFAVGDGIQIGSIASNDLEFAIVATVPDGTHITVTVPGQFGLEIGHASGVTVANGASVGYIEFNLVNSFPARRVARWGLAIGTNHQHIPINFILPTTYWYRMQWANSGRMWTDFSGSFG